MPCPSRGNRAALPTRQRRDNIVATLPSNMTTEAPQLPQLEVFHRVLTLPVIGSALSKSTAAYTRVKDSHQLVHWALTTVETTVETTVVPIAVPIAKKFENRIHSVDHTLCVGLDKIEEKVALVKGKPEQILGDARALAQGTMQGAVFAGMFVCDMILAEAARVRDKSWNKANQILDTHYGNVAITGFDSTAVVIDKLLDKYFPATEQEHASITAEKVDEHDKLLHTLQTVGRLSNKAARRVYSNIMYHVRTINKDNLKIYVSSLVEFLQITRYLHVINEKMHRSSAKADNGSANSEENTDEVEDEAEKLATENDKKKN